MLQTSPDNTILHKPIEAVTQYHFVADDESHGSGAAMLNRALDYMIYLWWTSSLLVSDSASSRVSGPRS